MFSNVVEAKITSRCAPREESVVNAYCLFKIGNFHTMGRLKTYLIFYKNIFNYK